MFPINNIVNNGNSNPSGAGFECETRRPGHCLDRVSIYNKRMTRPKGFSLLSSFGTHYNEPLIIYQPKTWDVLHHSHPLEQVSGQPVLGMPITFLELGNIGRNFDFKTIIRSNSPHRSRVFPLTKLMLTI